jgi:hypothetical protein
VELDAAHAGRFYQGIELALAEVVDLERLSEHLFPASDVRVFLREDKSELLMPLPIPHPDFSLMCFVSLQPREGFGRDDNLAE